MRAPVSSLFVCVLATAVTSAVAEPHTRKIDFHREVKPILSNMCFKCHGPDAAERKGGLRLDTADGIRGVLVW
jgi:hypothetical protein